MPGVFTADPRIVRDAVLLPRVSFEEMLELAVLGAKVLHYRAAELARRYRVPLQLMSSFEDTPGTVVRSGHDMEFEQINSVTSKTGVVLVRTRTRGDDSAPPGLMREIAARDVQIIDYTRVSGSDGTALTFVVDREDLEALREALATLDSAHTQSEITDGVASVSVVGSGLACSPHTLAEVERVLTDAGIPILHVGTSSLSITCIIPVAARETAVEILHMRFIDKARTPHEPR
ncbi:MAG: ACT domain-containing protein [bacterium]